MKKKSTNMQGYEAWAVGKIMSGEKVNREAMYRVLKSLWIYNIPFEQMDREVAIDVGKAIGEVVAIDWHDKNGRWTEYIRIRVKIDVLRPL
ncbi:hypothetical protein GOBAR_DD24350 [Gossypium barbadense]|nr:hypothetical protein GOBAR_DD24350 [Gossypium barbadense]